MSRPVPVWLNKLDVLAIHGRLLIEHGGLQGLRDEGLLDSALARPQNLLAYEEPDVFELAAACAVGPTKNHPFNDGNKRIAFMAAFVFLGVNGWDLRAPEADAVQAVLDLTTKRMDEKGFAEWLRGNCVAVGRKKAGKRIKKPRGGR